MTDHSSVDALSDDDVNERLRTALGEPLFCGYPPGYSSNETIFEHRVIPALDERGLGVQWIMTTLTMIPGVNDAATWAGMAWLTHKAPLSLRARAALRVLQSQESKE